MGREVRVAHRRAQYDESCRLCSEGSGCTCTTLCDIICSKEPLDPGCRRSREGSNGSLGVHETVTYPVADVSGSSPLTSSRERLIDPPLPLPGGTSCPPLGGRRRQVEDISFVDVDKSLYQRSPLSIMIMGPTGS